MIEFMTDDFDMDDGGGLTTDPQINDLLEQTDQLTADIQHFGTEYEENYMQHDDTHFNLTNDPSFNDMMDDTQHIIDEIQAPIHIPESDALTPSQTAGFDSPIEMPSADHLTGDPVIDQVLNDTNRISADVHDTLDKVYEDNPDLGLKPNSANEAVMNMAGNVVKETHDSVEGNLSPEEEASLQNRLNQQSTTLGIMNASDKISNSVNETQQHLLDRNSVHQAQIAADENHIIAESYDKSDDI